MIYVVGGRLAGEEFYLRAMWCSLLQAVRKVEFKFKTVDMKRGVRDVANTCLLEKPRLKGRLDFTPVRLKV